MAERNITNNHELQELNPTADLMENQQTLNYSYDVFSGDTLSQNPEVVDKIGTMLLAQPVARFRARFPKFPIHEDPAGVIKNPQKLTPMIKKRDQSQRSYVEEYLREITSSPDILVVVVYDNQGDVGVLADSYTNEHDRNKRNADVIRAKGSFPGDASVTTFAFQKLYQASFADDNVNSVSAYVHRGNRRSRRRMYEVLERMEEVGFPVEMVDGMRLNPDAHKPSKHWREFRVNRRT